jgi:polysaccharide export outer membrane protein
MIPMGMGEMAIPITKRGFIFGFGGAAVAWPREASTQQPVAAAASRNDTDKIGPHDVLDVTVFKVPDLSKTVQVNGAGTITYPLIGEIPVAGKTAHELERDLMKRLGDKYLRSPHITVTIKKSTNQ